MSLNTKQSPFSRSVKWAVPGFEYVLLFNSFPFFYFDSFLCIASIFTSFLCSFSQLRLCPLSNSTVSHRQVFLSFVASLSGRLREQLSRTSYMSDSLCFDLLFLVSFLPADFHALGFVCLVFDFGLHKDGQSCFTPVYCCAIVSTHLRVPDRLQDFLTNPGWVHKMSYTHSSEVWVWLGGKLEAFSYEGKTSKLNLSDMCAKTSESMWENVLWTDETKVQLSRL